MFNKQLKKEITDLKKLIDNQKRDYDACIENLQKKVYKLENPSRFKKGDTVKNLVHDKNEEYIVLENSFDGNYNWRVRVLSSSYNIYNFDQRELSLVVKSSAVTNS